VPSGTGAHLLARRRELDSRRSELADIAVARIEPNADEPPSDDEIVDLPVGLERALEPVGVDAGNEEVRVLRLEPEQLVADRAADEIRVEPE
jgi:hypothetical protein